MDVRQAAADQAYVTIDVGSEFADACSLDHVDAVVVEGTIDDAPFSRLVRAETLDSFDGAGLTVSSGLTDADVSSGTQLFVYPVLEDGSTGPRLPLDDTRFLGALVQPCRMIDGGDGDFRDDSSQDVIVIEDVGFHANGNALVVSIAYDASSSTHVSSVVWGADDTALTSLGVSSGDHDIVIEVFALENISGVTPPQILNGDLTITMSDVTPSVAVWYGELERSASTTHDQYAEGSDTSLTPTTNSCDETASANEALLAFLAVSGDALSTSPFAPENYTLVSTTTSGDVSKVTLYVYKQNVIAKGNYGFATTMIEERDWSVALCTFK